MSYWSESNTSQNFSKGGVEAYSSGPLMDDIAPSRKALRRQHHHPYR